MVKEAKIYVSKMDLERLTRLIEITKERDDNSGKLEYLDRLEEELDRADVVDPKDVPSDVITMRSKVRLKDLSTGEEMGYSLVFRRKQIWMRGRFRCSPPLGALCSATAAGT
jgi:regulator of nucleoside diphosphate kinase